MRAGEGGRGGCTLTHTTHTDLPHIGPTVFLTSDCIGCVTIREGLRECYDVMSLQYLVLSNLMFGYLFVLFSDFTHAHVTWEEMVCLSNTSLTTILKILVQASTSMIAFVVYGFREFPNNNFIMAAQITIFSMYGVLMIAQGIHVRRIRIEERRLEHNFLQTTTESNVWRRRLDLLFVTLKWPLKMLQVKEGRLQISPFFRGVFASTSILHMALYVSALYFTIEGNRNLSNFLLLLADNCFMLAGLCSICYLFSNFEAQGRTSMLIVGMVVPITSMSLGLAFTFINNEISVYSWVLLVFVGLCCVAMCSSAKKRLVENFSSELLRRYLIDVICTTASTSVPPLIFCASEHIACLVENYSLVDSVGIGNNSTESGNEKLKELEYYDNECQSYVFSSRPLSVLIFSSAFFRIVFR